MMQPVILDSVNDAHILQHFLDDGGIDVYIQQTTCFAELHELY